VSSSPTFQTPARLRAAFTASGTRPLGKENFVMPVIAGMIPFGRHSPARAVRFEPDDPMPDHRKHDIHECGCLSGMRPQTSAGGRDGLPVLRARGSSAVSAAAGSMSATDRSVGRRVLGKMPDTAR
jgi:hypothetical protein